MICSISSITPVLVLLHPSLLLSPFPHSSVSKTKLLWSSKPCHISMKEVSIKTTTNPNHNSLIASALWQHSINLQNRPQTNPQAKARQIHWSSETHTAPHKAAAGGQLKLLRTPVDRGGAVPAEWQVRSSTADLSRKLLFGIGWLISTNVLKIWLNNKKISLSLSLSFIQSYKHFSSFLCQTSFHK